ncbi:unnamed protein product [Agarophyton chilense]
MIAFTAANALPLLISPARTRLCRQPIPRPRIVRLPIRATYTPELQSPSAHILHSTTDDLITDVAEQLRSASPLSDATLQQMVLHLADSRGMARLALVESFGKVGSKALPTLITALRTCPNPVVRRSCGKALAKIGDPAATDPLLHALVHDEDTVTRSSAAGALAKMGAVAVPKLLQLISDPHVSMATKGHAAWAISFMQGAAGDALFASIQHPNPDVRAAVISALGAVAIGDALPAMGTAADDDWEDTANNDVRMRAIDALRKALDDQCAQVKGEAVTALANVGCKQDAGRIVQFLTDDDHELRRCAALALMKVGDETVVQVLRQRQQLEEVQSVSNVLRLAADTLERNAEDDDEWI